MFNIVSTFYRMVCLCVCVCVCVGREMHFKDTDRTEHTMLNKINHCYYIASQYGTKISQLLFICKKTAYLL